MFGEEFTIWSIPVFGLKIALLLLIIFIALLVHEIGHLIAARLLGLKVDKVQIGTGRILWDKTDRKNTHWIIHLIPFGAHVLINAAAFHTRPFWQRLITILAGPLINLALPFVLFAVFYLCFGQPQTPPSPVAIEQGLVADKAGLKPGDIVRAVDGHPVYSYQDIQTYAYETGLTPKVFLIERKGQKREITITPTWAEYTDEDGIKRENARFGILWMHTPLKLTAIEMLNGEVFKDDDKRIRESLLANMDKDVTIQIKGPDKGPYIYDAHLYTSSNPHLADDKHKERKLLYLGATRDNFYLYRPVPELIARSLEYASDRIGKIITLPLQIFPFDPYVIADDAAVGEPSSPIPNHLYALIHKLAVASIFIALINLLPLPYLDGGHIAVQAIESATQKPMSRKAKARLFAATFLGVYFTILFANMDNLPGYIDSRLKKLEKSLHHNDSKQLETKGKG